MYLSESFVPSKALRLFLVLLVFLPFAGSTQKTITQGYVWGIKAGPSYMKQRGHYRTAGSAFGWHADLFYDSYNSTSPNSLYFQLGYHERGAGLTRFYLGNLQNLQLPRLRLDNPKFLYRNAALETGIKKRYELGDRWKGYLGFGLRGEYTFDTNLDKYAAFNEEYKAPIYPAENFVKHYQYGFTILCGAEFTIWEEQYEGFTELRINQDLSNQYFQPTLPGAGFRDPYTGELHDLNEIGARNLTIELSFGLRIFRVYEYEIAE